MDIKRRKIMYKLLIEKSKGPWKKGKQSEKNGLSILRQNKIPFSVDSKNGGSDVAYIKLSTFDEKKAKNILNKVGYRYNQSSGYFININENKKIAIITY
jgi:hypothetical protein